MEKRNGFTLIELMIVVAIIGILAAIAVPQFSTYRAKSYNAQAQGILKGLSLAEEAYFGDHYRYTANKTALVNSYGFKTDSNINIFVTVIGGTAFTASGRHQSGDKTFYVWSRGGGVTMQRPW